MAATLWSLFILGFLVLVALGVGGRLCQVFRLFPADSFEADRFLFSAAIGLGAVSYTVLAIGLVRLLQPAVIFGVLGVAGVVCWRQCWQAAVVAGRLALAPGKPAMAQLRDRATRWQGAWLMAIVVLAVVYSLVVFIGALAPPASTDYDSLAYHLAIPALYLRWGEIRYDPYILHSNFPQTTEMLYLCGLAAHSEAARSMHFIFGLLCAGVCWRLARGYGRDAACLALLVFWMSPLVGWEASVGYDDLSFAFFQSLAFLAIAHSGHAHCGPWARLAGICQGLALGVKYSALALAPLLIAFCLYQEWQKARAAAPQGHNGNNVLVDARSTLRVAVKQAVVVSAWAALIASPWYLRTLIWTGNPVFPYYYSVFGGRNWSHEAETYYRQLQLSYGMGRDPAGIFLAPWGLLTQPARYYEPAGSATFAVLIGSLGPSFLLLPVMCTLAGRWRRKAALLAGLFGIFFLEWYLLMQQVRYLLAALPLLAPAWGLALRRGSPASSAPQPAPALAGSLPEKPAPVGDPPDAPLLEAPLLDAPSLDSPLADASPPALPLPDTPLPDAPMPDAPIPETCAGEVSSVKQARPGAASRLISSLDQIFARGVMTLSFAWTAYLFVVTYAWPSDLPCPLLADVGLVPREEYLARALPDLWPVSAWVAEKLPQDARVALIGEPRGYYMGRETLWADGYEQEKIQYASIPSGKELAKTLRKEKITFVVARLGSTIGLVAPFALPGINVHRATWQDIDYRRDPRATHWLSLYADAVGQNLLQQIYPDPARAPTDASGYAVYGVGAP